MFKVYYSPEELEGEDVVLFLKEPAIAVKGRVIYAGADELGPFLGILRSDKKDEKWDRKMERYRSTEVSYIVLVEDIEALQRERSKRRENNGETGF
ncbi:hypothetical protein Goe20_01840 [Bacillus phage vB_BsuM-Goe20]|nr:hypothetical protein Goe20_01840 [Bacillus phage vB_BsuM-Goe20]